MFSQVASARDWVLVWIAFAQLEEKEAVLQLEKAVKQAQDGRLLEQAINGLLEYNPEQALRLALRMFEKSSHPVVQEASGEVLATIGPAAISALEKLNKGPFRSGTIKARAQALMDRIQASDGSTYS